MGRPPAPVLVLAAALGGCSFAPHYAPPVTQAPAAFKEAPTGPWQAATPLDHMPRGAWWTGFGDPVLDDLEARVEAGSPTAAAAVARYDQAVALADAAASARLPTIGAAADIGRNQVSATRPLAVPGSGPQRYTDKVAGGTFTYEIDLWGRVRNTIRAGRAGAQASAADLESVRLSLHALVADTYFQLRGLDAEDRLLRQTVDAYSRAAELTYTRHQGGIASGLDINRARAQLSSARARISDIAVERAANEHALAVLVGASPSTFSIAPAVPALDPLAVPTGAPSTLVQRRPDIAAAERRMAAENARIGVARAAFFPTLTLGGSGGFETTGGNFLAAPNSFWALGPLSAAVTLFDGGRRAAQVRNARAIFAEAAADYRDTVLGAFREVEDNLAAARHLAVEQHDQDDAAAAAQRTSDLALERYHDGASDYLEVVVAQTAALDAQRASLSVHTRRLQTSVALIRALGGGYGAASEAAAAPAGSGTTAGR